MKLDVLSNITNKKGSIYAPFFNFRIKSNLPLNKHRHHCSAVDIATQREKVTLCQGFSNHYLPPIIVLVITSLFQQVLLPVREAGNLKRCEVGVDCILFPPKFFYPGIVRTSIFVTRFRVLG